MLFLHKSLKLLQTFRGLFQLRFESTSFTNWRSPNMTNVPNGIHKEYIYVYIYKSQIGKHYIRLSFPKVPPNCLTKPRSNLAFWNLQALRSNTMEPVFPYSVTDPGNGSFSVCSLSGGCASRQYCIPSNLFSTPK